ncbi:MAG TPA: precorrin-8X methylmutase [Pseudonocardiaceae bacterium]|nr:precorrin-8X methylmutase [Pseudonocardiaceae bacterium]
MSRVIHPIEIESYRIMRERVDTAHLPTLARAVTERIVHTTADPGWVGELVTSEQALAEGRSALLGGGPLLVDVRMVAAAVTSRECVVCLDLATEPVDGLTRSAAGIRAAARQFPDGAVWAIGNAPTALVELLRLVEEGSVRPALVIGLPVGFVGSVAAKSALRTSGINALSNVSERGGAAIAAAAVNALLYTEETG